MNQANSGDGTGCSKSNQKSTLYIFVSWLIWLRIEQFIIVGNATEKVAFLALLRIIRILRVFRIAKLGRHNQNLNRLVRTIKGSAKEFSFLCLLFTVSMVIFSALGFELFHSSKS